MATNTESPEEWCDDKIRQKLEELGSPVGPVTRSTRKFLVGKLKSLLQQQENAKEMNQHGGVYYSSGEESHGEDASKFTPTSPLQRFKSKLSESGSTSVSFDRTTRTCNTPESSISKRRGRPRKATNNPIDAINDFGTDSESDIDVVSYKGYESPQTNTMTQGGVAFQQLSPSSRSTSFREVRNKIKTVVCSNTIPNTKSFLIKEEEKFEDSEQHSAEYGRSAYYTDVFHECSCTGLRNTSVSRHNELEEEISIYYANRARRSRRRSNMQLYFKVLAILSCIVSVAFMFIRQQNNRMYIAVMDSDENIFPVCGQSNVDPSVCVEEKYLVAAVDVAHLLVPLVINLSIEAHCGQSSQEKVVTIPTVSDDDALKYLKEKMPDKKSLNLERDLKNFKILVLYNPHWEIEIVAYGMKDINRILFYGQIAARHHHLPIGCLLRRLLHSTLYYIPNFVVFTTIPFIIVFVFVLIYRYYKQKRDHRKNVYRLIKTILLEISARYKRSPDYLPIDQCKNVLIHPDESWEKSAQWKEAVEFIEQHESRVRTELRGSSGNYMKVWVWVPPEESQLDNTHHETEVT